VAVIFVDLHGNRLVHAYSLARRSGRDGGGCPGRIPRRFYGEDGDDLITAHQGSSGGDVPVSKAIVDCGPGTDEVYFDEGVDVIKNCEIKHP
jgi:hypothetical protein